MSHRRTRRIIGIGVRVLVLLAVVGIAAWAAINKPAESRMTQRGYYELATRSAYGVFSTYPQPRRVVADPVNKTYLELAFTYAKRAMTNNAEAGGDYDCRTRTVNILSEFVRAQAGLPDPFRPQFLHALRHEYGHAFVQDELTLKFPGTVEHPAFAEANKPRESSEELGIVAPELEPVVRDWIGSPKTLYGLEHNTGTFNEYLAESYARFMEGDVVPAATRRFLQSQASTASRAQTGG